MPKFNAFDGLKILQKTGLDLPFIVVSGTIGEDIAVEVMKAGAHDYLMKENLTRLVPAIKRELREAEIRRERKKAEEKIRILNQEIIDTQREIIFTLGDVLETRSGETANHVRLVAEYSSFLARKMGLKDEDVELVHLASPMHDVGKIGIPDSILNKPGKFTEEEFEFMKAHTTIGYSILNRSKRKILVDAALIALQHHERWDGEGYPNGLKGEEIQIFARITSVADVFDALSQNRVYRAAWDMETILELFKEERGCQFDPHLIDLFFDNLEEILAIKEKYLTE